MLRGKPRRAVQPDVPCLQQQQPEPRQYIDTDIPQLTKLSIEKHTKKNTEPIDPEKGRFTPHVLLCLTRRLCRFPTSSLSRSKIN